MANSYDIEVVHEYLARIGKLDEFSNYINTVNTKPNVTLVTGLWDLGRSKLAGWAQRDFEVYKTHFFKLLTANIPMYIYAPKSLHKHIWKIRSSHNTYVHTKEVSEFKTWFPFFTEHEQIRTNPDWYNKAGWLKDSPQSALPLYNPMMMTKMFMVNDAAIMNKFDTEYFYWIDGGLPSTVSVDLLTDPTIYQNITEVYSDKILHIAYPYTPTHEIHGYDKRNFYNACGLNHQEKTVYISRGGFWGGSRELIHKYNEVYYAILQQSLMNQDAGADECLFTIAAYKYPELIEQFKIDENGLVYPFFEQIKDVDTFKATKLRTKVITPANANVNLYVLGFNSPEQFDRLCQSIQSADLKLFSSVKKILINNSTDETVFSEYDRLCTEYDFEEIHHDNIGICGGRQFIAEHFDQSTADFYFFFEDDMCLNTPDIEHSVCKTGLPTYTPNLYDKLLKIIITHKFDFIKLSFSEFYGDNATQWAWYNVPQHIRTENWPAYDTLPESGVDVNSPKTKFEYIFSTDNLAYITGEIYYSNWPQIVSREGNKKMFLDTKWDKPYEQTWMSHMYQLTKQGKLYPAVLLASPITHDRFDHYEGSLRKES